MLRFVAVVCLTCDVPSCSQEQFPFTQSCPATEGDALLQDSTDFHREAQNIHESHRRIQSEWPRLQTPAGGRASRRGVHGKVKLFSLSIVLLCWRESQ